MKSKISYNTIISFQPCYDPSDVGIPKNESLSVKDWVLKYRYIVKNEKDILWLICRPDFMSDKDLRLFAVWCARRLLKIKNITNQKYIDILNIVERYANGLATTSELLDARKELCIICNEITFHLILWHCTYPAAHEAAIAASRSANVLIFSSDQVNQLLTYF